MSKLEPCPDYGDIFYSYHGASPKAAKVIKKGGINVYLGGGELGQGFYTGQYLHEAKAWAYHTTGSKKDNVVMFEQTIKDISLLSIKKLNIKEATITRVNLKKEKTKQTYAFGYDLVVSKIIGSTKVSGCQLKWESISSQTYLNGSKTTRSIPW